MPRGRFVVLEGCDRVGKSTQVGATTELLGYERGNCAVFVFPDRTTKTGVLIDAALKGITAVEPRELCVLFAQNRREKQADIQAALDAGRNVVADRYMHSGIAYGMANGLTRAECEEIEAEHGATIMPDLVLYVYLSLDKLVRRPMLEQFESPGTQFTVHHNFMCLYDNRWRFIDGDRSRRQVTALIAAALCVY